jgi:hypothetical protein
MLTIVRTPTNNLRAYVTNDCCHKEFSFYGIACPLKCPSCFADIPPVLDLEFSQMLRKEYHLEGKSDV